MRGAADQASQRAVREAGRKQVAKRSAAHIRQFCRAPAAHPYKVTSQFPNKMPPVSNATSILINNHNGLPPLASTKPLSLLTPVGLPAWGPYSPMLLGTGQNR